MTTIEQLEADLAKAKAAYDKVRAEVVPAEKAAKEARERVQKIVDEKSKLGGEVMRIRQAIKTLKAK